MRRVGDRASRDSLLPKLGSLSYIYANARRYILVDPRLPRHLLTRPFSTTPATMSVVPSNEAAYIEYVNNVIRGHDGKRPETETMHSYIFALILTRVALYLQRMLQ